MGKDVGKLFKQSDTELVTKSLNGGKIGIYFKGVRIGTKVLAPIKLKINSKMKKPSGHSNHWKEVAL